MKISPTGKSILEILGVFCIAFGIRVAFNLSLEQRLCHFGDAFFFLTSGAQLLTALKDGTLGHLSQFHASATLGVATMTSVSFVDRMLIDGPVFPAYLALIQKIIGLNPAAPHFDAYALQFAISNSLMDSLACTFIYYIGRLAFNRWTGVASGLLAALYPAAIINTASCYSEPFAYSLLSLWLALWLSLAVLISSPRRTVLSVCALSLALGTVTGLLMLAKPVFVLLPAVFLFLTALLKWKDIRPAIPHLVLAFVGLVVALSPWLAFTAIVTGKPAISVNRYPGFNFIMGNRLASDGWRDYPLPPITPDEAGAKQLLMHNLQTAPGQYASLMLRKLPRLWAGSWNNFELTFVLSPAWQDCVHEFLLALGAVGAVLALARHRLRSRTGLATLLLISVPLFHCLYLIFEPQSRYAFSAMPCVIVLAAYASYVLTQRSPQLFGLATAIAIFGACGLLRFGLIDQIENKAPLTVSLPVSRTVALSQSEVSDGYILVDADPVSMPFGIEAFVNEQKLPNPVPWWQLQKDTDELVSALSIQANGMGRTIQSFHQWWAYPVPATALKPGSNKIELRGHGTIYGDTDLSTLPSLTNASWTKAFTTVYRGEPRISTHAPRPDKLRVLFVAADGRSGGPLRPSATIPTKSPKTTPLTTTPVVIQASYPPSFFITKSPIKLSLPEGTSRFLFDAEVSSPRDNTGGYVSVTFSGTVDGKPVQWISPWQPTKMPASRAFRHWSFGDKIPEALSTAPDLTVSVTASPFPADLLFLKKKQALKREITLRNAKLEFYPESLYPAPVPNPVLR